MIDPLSRYAHALGNVSADHEKHSVMRSARSALVGAALLAAASVLAVGNAEQARGAQPTGKPIVIGNIGTVSKDYAKYTEYAPMQKAVLAWAEWMNKHGGINGHRIRVEVADDDNSVAKHYSLVQEMVEQKHVIAFVGNPAVDTQPASVRYLEEKGIPTIGGSLGNAIWGRSPMLFPHGIAETNRARMLMQAAALTGKHKFAFLTVPKNPRAMIIQALNSGPAQEAGIEVVFDAAVNEGANADNSSVCLEAQKAGVEIVTVAGDFETIASVMTSCAKSGFKPAYVTTGTITSPQYLTAVGKNAEGSIGVSRFLPWEGDKPAELKTYREIMKSHGLQLNQATLGGYISARIFEEAVKRSKGKVTSASLTRALRSLNGSDLNGLVAPLGFSASSGEFNPGSLCFWPLIVKNGEWRPMPGKDKVCLKEQR
jgi:branched-chain amino acid transport system substrate-binding protein